MQDTFTKYVQKFISCIKEKSINKNYFQAVITNHEVFSIFKSSEIDFLLNFIVAQIVTSITLRLKQTQMYLYFLLRNYIISVIIFFYSNVNVTLWTVH